MKLNRVTRIITDEVDGQKVVVVYFKTGPALTLPSDPEYITSRVKFLNAILEHLELEIPYLAKGGKVTSHDVIGRTNPVVVAEKGPELFTPGQTGKVRTEPKLTVNGLSYVLDASRIALAYGFDLRAVTPQIVKVIRDLEGRQKESDSE